MAAPEAAMSDLDDFLTTTRARQIEAEEPIYNGDPTPHLALWSRRDPVTCSGQAQGESRRPRPAEWWK
jgi:hypothetical protein